jgi:hypothetical protein
MPVSGDFYERYCSRVRDRSHPEGPARLLATRVGASLTAGTLMLVLAFIIIMVWIVRPGIGRKDPAMPGILKNQGVYE